MRLLFIGHSHIYALKWAFESRIAGLRSLGVEAEFLSLVEERYAHYRVADAFNGVAGYRFGDGLKEDLENSVGKADVIISCLGGNAHNIFGLVKHPQPFDFVLEEYPRLPLEAGADVVPSTLVEAAIRSQGGFPETTWGLAALRQLYRGRILHCQSPPPVADDAHLIEYAGAFEEKFKRLGLVSATLRYKLWRLHSRMIIEECVRNDIIHVECPPTSFDRGGFLRREMWNLDTTHANPVYGWSVLQHLAERIGMLLPVERRELKWSGL